MTHHQFDEAPPHNAIPTSLVANQPEIPPHHPRLDDLYGVGPDKPLGYLSLEDVMMAGVYPDDVIDICSQKGLSTIVQGKPHTRESRSAPIYIGNQAYENGTLHVYDELALGLLLAQHPAILEQSGWPSVASEFAERLSRETVLVEREPELYALVATAFRDKRPEYRLPPADS
ncbi:MAG TPA: hypothetical protein VLE99_06890 [Candidatus Saccharimonadales bacterium]|nr:hypothetical protein [Candidatus Saccharimonadales bacterium]